MHAVRQRPRVCSRSRLRGTQGARLYKVHVWVPAGFRGACSGRSKSRNLARNLGIAFRPARADQAHATPQNIISFLTSLELFQLSKGRQPRYNSRASSFSLRDSHERCSCVWVRECVCVRVIRILQYSGIGSRNTVSRTETGGAVQFSLLFFI